MIVVVGSKYSKKNDIHKIAESFDKSGLKVQVLYWEDLTFSVETSRVNITCDTYNFSEQRPSLVIAMGWYKPIYRDIAFSFALYLQSRKIPFWNSEMIEQRSTTKLSAMVQLALNDISIPRTTFCLEPKNSFLEEIRLPSIVKAIAASRGQYNFLIERREQLNDVELNQGYLVQEYLPNNHDLRVICYGGEPQMAMKRFAGTGTHLNNTSQGGTAEWVELSEIDEHILTESKNICKIMKREMAGIDFIPNQSSRLGYSCLEVNAIPQLTSGFGSDEKLDAITQYLNNITQDQ